jgi:protein-disulfide isomerase
MSGDLLEALVPGAMSRRVLLVGAAAGTLAACGPADEQTASQTSAETPTETAAEGGCAPSEPTRANAIQRVELKANDRVLGSSDAPLTIIEYASITCPHCAAFHAQTFPELKRRYIDTGKVKLVFRELPTGPAPLAMAGFLMARCAPEDKYYDVISLLFERQVPLINAYQAGGPGAREELVRIAAAMGISEERFDACIRDDAEIERINQWVDEATLRYGQMSTPAFVINGEITFGAMPIDDFIALIEPYVGVAC